MVMNSQQKQQGAPTVIPCYDELIAFLKQWFPHIAPEQRLQRPVLEIDRYSGNSVQFQKVVEWKVDQDAEGRLKELSIVCDNYTPLTVMLILPGISKQFKLQTAWTAPYNDLKLRNGERVAIYCKSDGTTAINFDASIIGNEMFVW